MNNAAKDKMVVVGQRIHEDDVSGYILKERPDWDTLILPAFYEPLRKCFSTFSAIFFSRMRTIAHSSAKRDSWVLRGMLVYQVHAIGEKSTEF
jgi:hypothetical protein